MEIDKQELGRLLKDIGNTFTRGAWVRGISWDELQEVDGGSA